MLFEYAVLVCVLCFEFSMLLLPYMYRSYCCCCGCCLVAWIMRLVRPATDFETRSIETFMVRDKLWTERLSRTESNREHTQTRLTQTRGNIDLSQITRFINNTFLWSRNVIYLFRIYILEAKKLIIKFGKQIVVVLPLFYIAAPSAYPVSGIGDRVINPKYQTTVLLRPSRNCGNYESPIVLKTSLGRWKIVAIS